MSSNQPTKLAKTKNPKTKSTLLGSYHYSGPIPHPSLLNQYDPKTRRSIIFQARAQSSHRQSIESAVIQSNIKNERTGMFIAGGLTLALIIAGVILIAIDKDVAGYISIFGPTFFQASNYIYNKNQEKKASKEEKPSS